MFRIMRRKQQQLEREECNEILYSCTNGILACSGDNLYPYAVPLSYIYDGEKIYFHGAKTGHKLDAIKRNPRVSFCVVAQDDVIQEKFTTHFRSVIVFGKAKTVEDDDEKLAIIRKLCKKYSPHVSDEMCEKAIADEFAGMCIIALTPEHTTGKIGKDLMNTRK